VTYTDVGLTAKEVRTGLGRVSDHARSDTLSHGKSARMLIVSDLTLGSHGERRVRSGHGCGTCASALMLISASGLATGASDLDLITRALGDSHWRSVAQVEWRRHVVVIR
jgi:hypothetical protein